VLTATRACIDTASNGSTKPSVGRNARPPTKPDQVHTVTTGVERSWGQKVAFLYSFIRAFVILTSLTKLGPKQFMCFLLPSIQKNLPPIFLLDSHKYYMS